MNSKIKKRITLIISILIIAALGIGATVYGISSKKTVEEVEKEQDQRQELAKPDEYIEREDADKTKTQIFYNAEQQDEEEEKELVYDKTWVLNDEKQVDIYKEPGNEDVEYNYAEERMVSWHDKDAIVKEEDEKKLDEKGTLDKEKVIALAINHVKEIYGVDVSQLEVKVVDKDEYMVYFYLKYGADDFVYGANTNVVIQKNGRVSDSYYSLYRDEDFDEKLLDGLTREKVVAYAEEQARKQYDAMKDYQFQKFDVEKICLEREDGGKYYLKIYGVVEYSLKQGNDTRSAGATYRYDF